jgi:hypothetical protein
MSMAVRFMNPKEIALVSDAINSDPEFKLASRFFSKDILLIVGDAKCIVKLRDGNVTEIKLNPNFMNPWSFFIKGSVETWQKFLQPIPPPFFTDLYGGISRQHFELGGDIEAAFAHYWALTRMLDVLRELENESARTSPPAEAS